MKERRAEKKTQRSENQNHNQNQTIVLDVIVEMNLSKMCSFGVKANDTS